MGEGLIKRFFWHFVTFRQYYIIFMGFLILAFLLFMILSIDRTSNLQNPFDCGDGTFEGYCSLHKPYFCTEGDLVENAGLCGCPFTSKLEMGKCVFEHNPNEWPIELEYVLDGKKNSISYPVYSEVKGYIEEIPRAKYYSADEMPRRDDFKLSKIDDEVQRDFLIPLVVAIQNKYPNSKDMQAKMAISLVQNIPYQEPGFVRVPGTNFDARLSKFPYEVIYEDSGSCEGKSELLAFILREMGFGVVLFYFPNENHEVLGISCPFEESYLNTGYCFVETTTPSPISYSQGRYIGPNGYSILNSKPQLVLIKEGISLTSDLEDYGDSDDLNDLVNKIERTGTLNPLQKKNMDELRRKYNLQY